jgi:hypothetical protein
MLAVTRIRADILRGAERLVGVHVVGMAGICAVFRMRPHASNTVLHLLWFPIGRHIVHAVMGSISHPMVPPAWSLVSVPLGGLAWLGMATTA